jgi:hypothetical protein
MRTDKQIQASRTNGSKSRGPVTAEGRLNSSGTRLRHGLYARAIVLDGESRKRFIALIESLYTEFDPQTASQEMLVERLAVAQWRQMRLWTYERSAITREAKKQREATGLKSAATVDSIAFQVLPPAKISQHEMRLDRQVARWYDRLMKIKEKVGSQEVIENNEESQK